MSEKYWKIHVEEILEDKKNSFLALTLNTLESRKPKRRRGLGFVFNGESEDSEEHVKQLIFELTHVVNTNVEKEQVMDDFNKISEVDEMIYRLKKVISHIPKYNVEPDKKTLITAAPRTERERAIFDLGIVFIKASYCGDAWLCSDFIEADFPVNFQHPITKKTALHVAAMKTFTTLTQVLLDSGKCDFLLKDKKGNLVVNLAYERGRDVEMYHLIKEETEKQANKRGVNVNFSFELTH